MYSLISKIFLSLAALPLMAKAQFQPANDTCTKTEAECKADERMITIIDSLAEELFKNKSVRSSESPGEPIVVTASVLAMFGHLDLARRRLIAGEKLDPNYGYLQFTLASVCALQADEECSIKALEKAIKQNSKYARLAAKSQDFDVFRKTQKFEALLNSPMAKTPPPPSQSAKQSDVNYVMPLSIFSTLVKSGYKVPTPSLDLMPEQIIKVSHEFVKALDEKEKIAPDENIYAIRMAKITDNLKTDQPIAIKVYLSPGINALSFADGSIRVQSGMMDIMRDDELMAVLGHETGHVVLKHRAQQILALKISSAWGSSLLKTLEPYAVRASEDLEPFRTDPLENNLSKLVEGKFSQDLENAADDYAVEFLKKNGVAATSMASALKKLARYESNSSQQAVSSDGSSSSANFYVSTHLEARKRAERLEAKTR